MENTIMRIYMTVSEKARPESLTFWQRVLNGSLASFLLKKAKEEGIEQAICQRVSAGYLKGKNIAFDLVETIPPDLPQCVELVDSEQNLRNFFERHKEDLRQCRVAIFKTAELMN